MNRLLNTIRLDVTVQWRNKLYAIGIGLSLLLAAGLGAGFPRERLGEVIPLLFLFAIGGTSMLYIVGLLIFEKDQGTLDAMLISPLRLREYMASKIVTLALIALVESLIVVALAYGVAGFDWIWLVAGIALMSVMLTLAGFILVVRFNAITDTLMPLVAIALVSQLPFLYFSGMVPGPVWLLIPTAAPTMLMWAAWNPVEPWALIYGIVYSVASIAVLYRWATAAFHHHIVLRTQGA